MLDGSLLLRAEGFFCSLNVLYRGLGKSKLQFLIKNTIFFSAANFFWFWVIKTLDPDSNWYSAKMLDSDLEKINPDPKHWCSPPTVEARVRFLAGTCQSRDL